MKPKYGSVGLEGAGFGTGRIALSRGPWNSCKGASSTPNSAARESS